jgi:hypothetical protein
MKTSGNSALLVMPWLNAHFTLPRRTGTVPPDSVFQETTSMKRIAYLLALVLTFALTGHANAQDKMGGKMSGGKMSGGKMSGGKMSGSKMAPAATQSFTGPVKGSPVGRTFTMGLRKGPMAVDAGKAKIRVNGKFAKMDVIQGGAFVTVVGKMSGTTFMADTVTVKSMPGGKKMGAMPADKSKSKMIPVKAKM